MGQMFFLWITSGGVVHSLNGSNMSCKQLNKIKIRPVPHIMCKNIKLSARLPNEALLNTIKVMSTRNKWAA